jgi:hypothetical protein
MAGLIVGVGLMFWPWLSARNDAKEWQGCYDRLWAYWNPTGGVFYSHGRHHHHGGHTAYLK